MSQVPLFSLIVGIFGNNTPILTAVARNASVKEHLRDRSFSTEDLAVMDHRRAPYLSDRFGR